MDSIGAEVGQKMRSAIKAKLMELECYVDDELPDYIMVMVANKRTKSQMNEDLNLFLSNKTSTFVEWLHIVLKRLKEVTVTNPEVYKKVVKTKDSSEYSDVKVKKEKKSRSKAKKSKKENEEKFVSVNSPQEKSLTDDLPINANKLAEKRKIVIMQDIRSDPENVMEDNFDIPPLSQVNLSSETELEDIERKIKSVKSRLGLVVESDSDDADFLDLKPEPDDVLGNADARKIKLVEPPQSDEERVQTPELQSKETRRIEHARITFDSENNGTKKKSVLDRLGKRSLDELDKNASIPTKKNKINLVETRIEEERISGSRNSDKNEGERKNSERRSRKSEREISRETMLTRLGVMSKVSVPPRDVSEKMVELEEIKTIQREVPSAIKVKPRVLPPSTKQANKNLLLKAVAEAQRSIAQTPKVGTNKVDALYTKKYKEKLKDFRPKNSKPQKLNSRDEFEYMPKPVALTPPKNLEYTPTKVVRTHHDDETLAADQKFVITLDSVERTKFMSKIAIDDDAAYVPGKKPKRVPSPIVFEKTGAAKLATVKIKERCRYWPSCKQGDKCEFSHPVLPCKMFPQCKYGEKCFFVHPSCKFASSCTRRECPYTHALNVVVKVQASSPTTPLASQTCKFFPNCTNVHCTFYHPRACKYGQFCKNQAECNFSHSYTPLKSNLTWRSTFQS